MNWIDKIAQEAERAAEREQLGRQLTAFDDFAEVPEATEGGAPVGIEAPQLPEAPADPLPSTLSAADFADYAPPRVRARRDFLRCYEYARQLRGAEGVTLADMADVMQVSTSTVKGRLKEYGADYGLSLAGGVIVYTPPEGRPWQSVGDPTGRRQPLPPYQARP